MADRGAINNSRKLFKSNTPLLGKVSLCVGEPDPIQHKIALLYGNHHNKEQLDTFRPNHLTTMHKHYTQTHIHAIGKLNRYCGGLKLLYIG